MKKPLAQMVPLLARGLAPTAAVVSGLLSPAAMGASGDLDPSFADLGRKTDLILAGPAWSLEPLENDEMLLAGGDDCRGWYCSYYYDYYAFNFVSRLSGTGAIDEAFTAAELDDVEVFDVVLQPDRKVIGVGRTVENSRDRSSLTIFRLEPDGALDLTFGEDGIVRWGSGTRNTAGAVALDTDGRIVVAGSQEGRLIVLRLFPDGTRDDSFGSSGEFQGPANQLMRRMHIVRTEGGGYRVTVNSSASCSVVALTASGELDAAFGTAGVAQIGAGTRCNSMTAQPDGRLLVAGGGDDRGFATRLLASGATDPSFAADVVADVMPEATAVAVGPDDSIVVAGWGDSGVPGALIVRVLADGELDVLFGQAGRTWIDLPTDYDASPAIHDMTVLPDHRIVAAGGYLGNRLPFAIRLLGETGGDAPGVISIMSSYLWVEEQAQQAVVTLRRSGGATGSVSVDYQTSANDWDTAIGGVDYTQVAGRLTWADGDFTERQIIVPIASNDSAEASEWFYVTLDNTQGGVGLGTRLATIEIVGDPQPPSPQPPGGPAIRPRSGGGALGFLSLLLLGVIRFLQRSRRASG